MREVIAPSMPRGSQKLNASLDKGSVDIVFVSWDMSLSKTAWPQASGTERRIHQHDVVSLTKKFEQCDSLTSIVSEQSASRRLSPGTTGRVVVQRLDEALLGLNEESVVVDA